MNKTRVSKAYRGQDHIGWKKTVGGQNWFLWYGTSPSDEAKAIAIETALEAKWQLVKLAGGSALTQTDFEEARDLALGRSSQTQTRFNSIGAATMVGTPVMVGGDSEPKDDGPVRRWLHSSIDEFVSCAMRTMKPDMSNGDHVVNTRDRILRARAIEMPRRKRESARRRRSLRARQA